MKKTFTALALLLGPAAAHAQTAPDMRSQYTQLVDSLIAPLDKSRIPGGILYDRVPALAGLHTFTQYTPSSASHFFQSYFELRESAYGLASFTQERGELRPLAEAQATAARSMGGVLPVGVLDYQFAVLDTLAEERGTIWAINGLYYDGAGSPYQTNQVTVVAPLADSVAQQVRLTMPAMFQFRNTGRVFSYGFVLVGKSQYYLSPNAEATITFPGTGWQSMTFTLYYNDGSTSTSRGQVYVQPTLATRPASYVQMPLTPNIIGRTWRDYDGLATYGEGEATAFLMNPSSKNDAKLRRPVIVIDGFDPGDRRGIMGVYGSIEPLVPALNLAGQERDLIILNLPRTNRRIDWPGKTLYKYVDGGADYIERNALVLVELLNRIKPLMADPNQKVSIIGPSMGALISRYALALMEKNYANSADPATYNVPYWKHNVDLWFSFDGPHQGANIPLGDQEFIDYFRGVSENAETNAGRLNSVAARQMLINHRIDPSGNNYHVPFMRNLQANGLPGSYGYPTQVRRVALANGSDNGQLNSSLGSFGVTGIQMDAARKNGNKRRQFFYRSTTPGTQIAANMYFSPDAGARGTVFNGEARVIVAALKEVQKRREVKVTSGSQGSYDLAPGGTFNTQYLIQEGTMNGKQLPGIEYRFTTVRPNHSFIPTVSALGFQYRSLSNYGGRDQLPSPYTDLTKRALICNDEIPFDSYYAYPGSNGAHVTLDGPAEQFVVRELFNVTQPPTFRYTNVKTICPNGTTSINLTECGIRGGAVTYNWSLTGPAVFINTGTNTSPNGDIFQTIRATGPGTITLSVVAIRTGAAPSPAATYSLESVDAATGLDLYVELPQGQVTICPYSTVKVKASGMTNGPYYWTRRTVRAGTTTTAQNITTSTPELPVTVRYDEVEVTVTAPSSCSGALLPVQTISVAADASQGRFCDPYSYAVSPVPSDQFLEVSTLATANPTEAAEQMRRPDEENPHAYKAEMYNDKGRMVQTGTTRKGQLRFNTRDLPSGLYHVLLKRGNQTVTRNIVIQH